jgi:hypothetical protein
MDPPHRGVRDRAHVDRRDGIHDPDAGDLADSQFERVTLGFDPRHFGVRQITSVHYIRPEIA